MSITLPQNLGLDLVRVTETAALSAGHWMGLGLPWLEAEAVDEAVFNVLNMMNINGRIVLGEERKLASEAYLREGTRVGSGQGPRVDVLCDPIDGLNLLADSYPGAVSGIAVAPRDSIWNPSPAVYTEKIIVGSDVAEALVPECMTAPIGWTLALIARVLDKEISELTVFILDRPRHAELIQEIRTAGARIMMRKDGEIIGALRTCWQDGGVDILIGMGGAMEGLLTACAVKVLGGEFLCRLAPQDESEKKKILDAGHDIGKVLTIEELIKSNSIFFTATGITDSHILRGVRYAGQYAKTNSMVLRGETRTRRLIFAEHLLDKWLPV